MKSLQNFVRRPFRQDESTSAIGGEKPTETLDEDHPRTISVEWGKIEAEIGEEIEADTRRKIERDGATSYDHSQKLSDALDRYACFNHPNGGPLDPTYLPYSPTSYILTAFKKINGVNTQLPNKTENLDIDVFCEGVTDLVGAARDLVRRTDDWYDDRHPIVVADGYGSETLDTVYIRCAHSDLDALERVTTSDLPIECASAFLWEKRPDDHYTVIYRHEDSSDLPQQVSPIVADQYAESIDLLDVYSGPHQFRRQNMTDDYMITDGLCLPDDIFNPIPSTITKSDIYSAGPDPTEATYAHTWVEEPQGQFSDPSNSLAHIFLFDGLYDKQDVEDALLLDRHLYTGTFGRHLSNLAHLNMTQLPKVKWIPNLTNKRLQTLSQGDCVELTLHDGRKITATVSEDPRHTPVTWQDGVRERGHLALTLHASASDDYPWLEDEASTIRVSADKTREWNYPLVTTTRTVSGNNENRLNLSWLRNNESNEEQIDLGWLTKAEPQ